VVGSGVIEVLVAHKCKVFNGGTSSLEKRERVGIYTPSPQLAVGEENRAG
jgi:hypothetical protein